MNACDIYIKNAARVTGLADRKQADGTTEMDKNVYEFAYLLFNFCADLGDAATYKDNAVSTVIRDAALSVMADRNIQVNNRN